MGPIQKEKCGPLINQKWICITAEVNDFLKDFSKDKIFTSESGPCSLLSLGKALVAAVLSAFAISVFPLSLPLK